MSVQSEIDRITDNISNAYEAAEEKGAVMPVTQSSANLAETINSIPAGSVNIPGVKKYQQIYRVGYTATIDLSKNNMAANGNVFLYSMMGHTILDVINMALDEDSFYEFEVWIKYGQLQYSLSWFEGITWEDGSPPDIAPNQTIRCVFFSVNGVDFSGNAAHEIIWGDLI